MKHISDNLSIAGQVTPQELQQIATAGFKSVINLRASQEDGFLQDEQQQAESVGLEYAHLPVKPREIDDTLVGDILQKIDALPKPILLHCASATRAGFLALMYLATRHQLSIEQVFAQAEKIGFDVNSNLQLKDFLTDYIKS